MMTERTIFFAALDITNPADRAAYVQRACAGDAALRRQVDALLAAHERSGDFLDVPAIAQGRAVGPTLNETIDLTSGRLAAADRPTFPEYEILEELGRGGMGVVYKAWHLPLKRVVAIKVVLTGAHAEDLQRARFRTEAEAIARLQHPNIVQIYEIGEQGGLPWFALEFCAGESLAAKLGGTPLPPA